MFGWSSSVFDKLLEKATSPQLLENDWQTILQICDTIRQGDVQPKYALNAIKKKLYTRNPHVTLYALEVLESCVKNCGASFHQEVLTKSFMEDLRDLIKVNTNDAVRDKVLTLMQTWAHAFRNDPTARAVQDIHNLMKVEGFKFPVFKESDAMFTADEAPDWADDERCHHCRVQFTITTRKHHCRRCGQVFCQRCSSQSATVPQYGIEKPVRVCDTCFIELNNNKPLEKLASSTPEKGVSSPKSKSGNTAGAATSTTNPGGKTDLELKEEEELQLAIALSQSEAESKGTTKPYSSATTKHTSEIGERSSHAPSSSGNTVVGGSGQTATSVGGTTTTAAASGGGYEMGVGNNNSTLSRYLDRNYWDDRSHNHRDSTTMLPSAPTGSTCSESPQKLLESLDLNTTPTPASAGGPDATDDDFDQFVESLRNTLEIFTNRLKSNAQRGRLVANDTYVQSLFLTISNLHAKLLQHIQEQDDLRAHYEGLEDKLNQIHEARGALDALREEHHEQRRRAAEEQERLRQMQLQQKLQAMRLKKQEYLHYQHQLAMQRIQEQEREMALRQEMQKQQHIVFPAMGGQPGQYMPQQGMVPPGVVPPTAYGTPPQGMMAPPQSGYVPQQHLPPQQQQQQPQPQMIASQMVDPSQHIPSQSMQIPTQEQMMAAAQQQQHMQQPGIPQAALQQQQMGVPQQQQQQMSVPQQQPSTIMPPQQQQFVHNMVSQSYIPQQQVPSQHDMHSTTAQQNSVVNSNNNNNSELDLSHLPAPPSHIPGIEQHRQPMEAALISFD